MSTLSLSAKDFSNPMDGLLIIFEEALLSNSINEDLQLGYLFISKKGNDFIEQWMSQSNSPLKEMEDFSKILKFFPKVCTFENGTHDYYFLLNIKVNSYYSKVNWKVYVHSNTTELVKV